MHQEQHPKSGTYFRINLEKGHIQAGYDQMLHGNLFQLLDWADRLELDERISRRKKEIALMFYAHRCLPDLPLIDPVPPEMISLDGLVYGIFKVTSEYPGPRFAEQQFTAILQEAELMPIDV